MVPAARPGRRVSDQGQQGYRLSYGGIGLVKAPEAQVSVKKKIFQRGKASYKAKSSDWRFAKAACAVLHPKFKKQPLVGRS
jgi:hypothetical protein